LNKAYAITAINENTLTIRFGDSIDPEVNKKVFRLYRHLLNVRHSSWLDMIPAYTTLSMVYDVAAIRQHHSSAFEWMKSEITKHVSEVDEHEIISSRQVRVPVCYDADLALDANRFLNEKNMSREALIEIHTSKMYQVYMIGFLPGFAYMGSVDQRIALSRLSTPRTQVTAGSVGIAGEQTGIYPLDSPGGWNIIGRTPLKVFDLDSTQPVLFQPGDQVKFVPMTKEDFQTFDPLTYNVIVS
jgi:inhibitor of KinA